MSLKNSHGKTFDKQGIGQYNEFQAVYVYVKMRKGLCRMAEQKYWMWYTLL